tara:strand:+ start:837 stop:1466 length:630 start_codon:yes stop_codon:yes gene_type:complete
MVGFVLGNGESRKDFDLKRLFNEGPTYGCNAIHRDYIVQNLICNKLSHLQEAIQSQYEKKAYLHTTVKMISIFKNPYLQPLPKIPFEISTEQDKPENWKSGSYATLLAATENNIVTLLGFDLKGLGERSFLKPFGDTNNIYKSSQNYPNEKIKQRDLGPDVQQLGRIINHFSSVKFIFIGDFLPEYLLSLNNTYLDSYQNFEKQLLTTT